MYWNKLVLSIYFGFSSIVYAQDKTKTNLPANQQTNQQIKTLTFSGKQSEEWMTVQNQLITAKGKVENQQKLVENLIQQKANLKGPELAAKIESLKLEVEASFSARACLIVFLK